MDNNVIVELGCDFNSNWEFKDGDLKIVDNNDNLVQSILNRLNCDYDSLDLYYSDYGSVLTTFLGWKKSDKTLEFIKLEVTNALEQEPRIDEFDIEVEYNSVGKILIDLTFYFGEDNDFSLSLVLDEEGVSDASGE